MYAAAYLRRSSVSIDSPGDASRDAQLSAVRSLCGDDVTVYTDWGISGRKVDRPEYQRLRADIAAGKVSSVCAYSLSRLGRSTIELLRFVELCQAHDVAIRTKVENIDTSSAMGRMLLTIMAAVAQLEAELAQERIGAALAAKRANGDELGQPHYGYRHEKRDGRVVEERDPSIDLEPIRRAYLDAGSVLGAVRRLAERNVPSPKGRTWGTSAVTRVLEHNWPEVLPQRNQRGRRQPSNGSIFSQLVRCPFCGTTLTPNTTRRQLYCRFGARDRASHPRYTVTERSLLPWAKAEAARLHIPADGVEVAERVDAKRAAIEARWAHYAELYAEGVPGWTRDRYDREKARAQRELDGLEAQRSAVALPSLDWSWTPDKINVVLRAMWERIDLDEQMRPGGAVWTVPEWRAA